MNYQVINQLVGYSGNWQSYSSYNSLGTAKEVAKELVNKDGVESHRALILRLAGSSTDIEAICTSTVHKPKKWRRYTVGYIYNKQYVSMYDHRVSESAAINSCKRCALYYGNSFVLDSAGKLISIVNWKDK